MSDLIQPIRPITAGEEAASAVTHGLGAAALLVGAPILMRAATRQGAYGTVGASVFLATALFLYVVSTLYHALPPSRGKRFFQTVDRCAIFVLIAGTYTPFSLGTFRGAWGWSLLGVVWGLAAVGVALELVFESRHRAARPIDIIGANSAKECVHIKWWPRRVIALTLYLAMGWLVVVAIVPLVQRVPLDGILLLLAGGLAYTIGVTFYVLHRPLYFHPIWHLFVLAGTAFHFFAVLHYAV